MRSRTGLTLKSCISPPASPRMERGNGVQNLQSVMALLLFCQLREPGRQGQDSLCLYKIVLVTACPGSCLSTNTLAVMGSKVGNATAARSDHCWESYSLMRIGYWGCQYSPQRLQQVFFEALAIFVRVLNPKFQLLCNSSSPPSSEHLGMSLPVPTVLLKLTGWLLWGKVGINLPNQVLRSFCSLLQWFWSFFFFYL